MKVCVQNVIDPLILTKGYYRMQAGQYVRQEETMPIFYQFKL